MTACAEASAALGEPLVGTAPEAPAWVVLEQPGPWGRKAMTESHLDPVLGEALEVAAAAHNARVALVRRPGRHPDRPGPRARRLWIASTRPGRSWLLGGWIGDITDLGGLSWSGIANGDVESVNRSIPALRGETDPVLLICTNGRRDVCCAIKGRRLIGAVRDRLPDRVWETIHLGGHRFAPTAVLLPAGVTYGRLDPDRAVDVYRDGTAGRVVLDGYRGRSTYSPPGQVAEAAVRSATWNRDVDALEVVSVHEHDGDWRAVVGHRDGRRWQVEVTERQPAPARPISCGAAPVNPIAYDATPPVPVS